MSTSEKFWNKSAEKYAKSPISDEVTYQRKLSETEQFLTSDMHILEFGCGTGSTALHHSANVKHIDAIDISENMIEIGRRRAEERHIENVSFFHGTLQDFGAADASMDAVLGLNVIHLIPNRIALLNEVARIVKKNGVFITSTVCLGSSFWRFIKPAIPLGKRLGLMPDLLIINPEELTREIGDVGFSIERRWFHGKSDVVMFIVARRI